MLEKYCAVIFDFDGTLYDFKGVPQKLIMNNPLSLFTIKAERDIRRSMKGIFFGSKENFRKEQSERLCRKSGFKTPESALSWYENVYMKSMISILKNHYTGRDSAEKVFKFLKEKNIYTAVFSDYSFVKERMSAVNLSPDLCDYIFSAEDLGGLKPAVEPFLKIAEIMKVSPDKILVVGDRDDTDGEGARKAGMDFIQIITHKTKEADYHKNHPLLSFEEFSTIILSEN